jgi:hypothetical protein
VIGVKTTTADRATSLFRPPTAGRWSFFGSSSLPTDPIARSHEKRGRRWLVLSYLFCPCHIPLTLALLGALLSGSAVGAAITGNAVRVGVALTAVYAVILWRGFREIRRAKRIEAAGGVLACTPRGCELADRSSRTAVHSGHDQKGTQ